MTEELPHVRCLSCNNILANKWEKYQDFLSQGMSIEDALNRLGLRRRWCCRMRLMSPFKVVSKVDRQKPEVDESISMEDRMRMLTKGETRDVTYEHDQEILEMDEGMQERRQVVNAGTGVDLVALNNMTPEIEPETDMIIAIDDTPAGIDIPGMPNITLPPPDQLQTRKEGRRAVIRGYTAR